MQENSSESADVSIQSSTSTQHKGFAPSDPSTTTSIEIHSPRKTKVVAPRGSHRTVSLKISAEEFRNEIPREERELFTSSFEQVVFDLLQQEQAVFLDGFGILRTTRSKKPVIHELGERFIQREETFSYPEFEKCADLTSYHYETYPGIIDSREIAARVLPLLPISLAVSWGERVIRRYVRGLIEDMKQEVVLCGRSRRLSRLGEFYALHNRQGRTTQDWFAGADVFLESPLAIPLGAGPAKVFERPLLLNSHEPFDATFGKAVHSFTIDLQKELLALGYASDEEAVQGQEFTVSVYSSAHGENQVLLYCTEGIRTIGFERSKNPSRGVEFVFQLHLESDQQIVDQEDVPHWPARVLTLGWVLTQSRSSGTVSPGAIISADHPLGQDCGIVTAVLADSFEAMPGIHSVENGHFEYINLVGIGQSEMEIAEDLGPKALLSILRRKSLNQRTRAKRAALSLVCS